METFLIPNVSLRLYFRKYVNWVGVGKWEVGSWEDGSYR